MDERRQQSVTISAKTVDEAIVEAERELGVSRDSLDITVITEGAKGFLGMRAENARILAMVVGPASVTSSPTIIVPPAAPPKPAVDTEDDDDLDDEDEDEDDRAEKGVGVPGGEEDEDEDDLDDGEARSSRSVQRRETAVLAKEILDTLLRAMGIPAAVEVRSFADPIVLDVETESGGLLIGRRGETLSALQYLLNVLIGRRTRGWTKVVIDVEHWRTRREDTLRALATRQAQRARDTQLPVALDPMPASERRVVHLTLQEMPDIATHSEGEEPNRRLIITPR